MQTRYNFFIKANHMYVTENKAHKLLLWCAVQFAKHIRCFHAKGWMFLQAFLLEASQGDAISGKVARGEVAQAVAAAIGTPAAAGVISTLAKLYTYCIY